VLRVAVVWNGFDVAVNRVRESETFCVFWVLVTGERDG